MSRFAIPRRAPLVRLFVLLLSLWQIGTALVPHTEALGMAIADRPQLETGSGPLVPGHLGSDCPACLAQHTTQLGTRPVQLFLLDDAHRAPQVSTASQPNLPFSTFFRFSRAPPLHA